MMRWRSSRRTQVSKLDRSASQRDARGARAEDAERWAVGVARGRERFALLGGELGVGKWRDAGVEEMHA
jgi:hypothetical protein